MWFCRKIDVLVEEFWEIIDELTYKMLIISFAVFYRTKMRIFSPERATYHRQWCEPLLECPIQKKAPKGRYEFQSIFVSPLQGSFDLLCVIIRGLRPCLYYFTPSGFALYNQTIRTTAHKPHRALHRKQCSRRQ